MAARACTTPASRLPPDGIAAAPADSIDRTFRHGLSLKKSRRLMEIVAN